MEPGDRVFDTEDDDPNLAIVVRVPTDESIGNWTYEKDGDEISAAEENSEYPPDAQLVNVTFEEYLEETWPEWTDVAPTDLWDGIRDRDIPVYGFPRERLGYVEPPTTLEAAIDQLKGNVDVLEWRPIEQHLHIEKMSETYAIDPDGTISGEGMYADHLGEIIEGQTEESTYKYEM
jgi:hypothetical protein